MKDNLKSSKLPDDLPLTHLDKSTSATSLTRAKMKSCETRISHITKTVSSSPQSIQTSEFAFFLKLKMINLIRLLDDEKDIIQEKLSEDPNELLAVLGKKVSRFQK